MSTHIVNDNGIDREATADEISEIEQRAIQAAQAKAEADAKAATRAAALAKLGLTADEITALFG